MRSEIFRFIKIVFITGIVLLVLTHSSCAVHRDEKNMHSRNSAMKLHVSRVNPHLLENKEGVPVFLNNYTAWKLVLNGSREDIVVFLNILKLQKFNTISFVLLNDRSENKLYKNDTMVYGSLPFLYDVKGMPDPSKPLITKGNDPNNPAAYDYWDHVDFIVEMAEKKGIYTCMNPTWGSWVSGGYSGPSPGDPIVFNLTNAYDYGFWLGKRYAKYNNIIWMLGGDRSAVYKTKGVINNFKSIWDAMAEGLADGVNGIFLQDGKADYKNIMISYHPRKWAPNSSEWFHNKEWLSFNSIQDTPYDQINSVDHDYNLKPIKPVWLFEGRYEGATSAWSVRYQAYQTVLGGGFGHTYGNDNWGFPSDWREITQLEGEKQMSCLYAVCRDLWTDAQFLDRVPDQKLIIGDPGKTIGDGMTIKDGDGGPGADKNRNNATSDRISAMRSKDGSWAIVYSANGRNIPVDLSRLKTGKLSAFWFNPRNSKWTVNGREYVKPTYFLKKINDLNQSYIFDPPGDPGPDNDWVLVLKE